MSAAAAAVRHSESSVASWLEGLISGEGDSPSQIIVTGILGVVPGVGQVMDARDIIIGIIGLTKSPANAARWLSLLITLIGCVPAVGDALKVGFKLMVQGRSLARILDATSPAMRGNVERWFKHIDWRQIASHAKGLFNQVIAAFIDALDGWVVKTVLGRQKVRIIIAELEGLRRSSGRMLDEAIEELKKFYNKAISEPLPASTARHGQLTPTPRSAAPALRGQHPPATPAPRRPARTAPNALKKDKTPDQVGPNRSNPKEKRENSQRKSRRNSGVLAGHLTDYYVKATHANFKKANNGGRLIEENGIAGRKGLDHLWNNATNPTRPGVVGETKSSILDALPLILALPSELREQFNALRASEGANPTPSGTPDPFTNADRDRVSPSRTGADNEDGLRKGLNKPNPDTGLATQMSHAWIVNAISSEALTAAGTEIRNLSRQWYRRIAASPDPIAPPYQRWVFMISGRQMEVHRKSAGKTHQIQKPIIQILDHMLMR